MDEREKDIQEICNQVLNVNLETYPDYAPSCPFCGNSDWVNDIDEIQHEQNCAYLIAKDLSTGYKNQNHA